MDSKTVLENFKRKHEQDCSQDQMYYAQKAYCDCLEETVEALKQSIAEALTAAESVPSCSQWIVAKEILEQALKEASDV